MATKFQQGQTVWGVHFSFRGLMIGSATVKSCGSQVVRLSDGSVPGFRYRLAVPVAEAFASETEALEWAVGEAQRMETAAEASLQRARELTQMTRDAIAKLVLP